MPDSQNKKNTPGSIFVLMLGVAVVGAVWSWTPQWPLFKDSVTAKSSYYQSNKLAKNLKEFKVDLHDWDTLERQQKFDLMEYVLNFLKTEHNVRITKSPTFYINRIDEELKASADMRELPIERVVTILAIMEYDFDNGHDDPESLALKVLGPKVFAMNKERKKDYQPRLE